MDETKIIVSELLLIDKVNADGDCADGWGVDADNVVLMVEV